MVSRGGTVSFNLYDENAHIIPHYVPLMRANACGISLRAGCVCNPGIPESAFNASASQLGTCALSTAVSSR